MRSGRLILHRPWPRPTSRRASSARRHQIGYLTHCHTSCSPRFVQLPPHPPTHADSTASSSSDRAGPGFQQGQEPRHPVSLEFLAPGQTRFSPLAIRRRTLYPAPRLDIILVRHKLCAEMDASLSASPLINTENRNDYRSSNAHGNIPCFRRQDSAHHRCIPRDRQSYCTGVRKAEKPFDAR